MIHSAIRQAQGGGVEHSIGTPERVASLRGDCLVRDRHRCVISRDFDYEEGRNRLRTAGEEAKDDDGNSLATDPKFSHLEVAHILPHSLTTGNDPQLVCFSRLGWRRS